MEATFDAIMDKHQVNDAVVHKIGDIRDFEFHEGKLEEIQLKETRGVCCILRGLEKISETDDETVTKAIMVRDAL